MTPLFIGGIGKGEQTLTLFIQILPFLRVLPIFVTRTSTDGQCCFVRKTAHEFIETRCQTTIYSKTRFWSWTGRWVQ